MTGKDHVKEVQDAEQALAKNLAREQERGETLDRMRTEAAQLEEDRDALLLAVEDSDPKATKRVGELKAARAALLERIADCETLLSQTKRRSVELSKRLEEAQRAKASDDLARGTAHVLDLAKNCAGHLDALSSSLPDLFRASRALVPIGQRLGLKVASLDRVIERTLLRDLARAGVDAGPNSLAGDQRPLIEQVREALLGAEADLQAAKRAEDERKAWESAHLIPNLEARQRFQRGKVEEATHELKANGRERWAETRLKRAEADLAETEAALTAARAGKAVQESKPKAPTSRDQQVAHAKRVNAEADRIQSEMAGSVAL